MLKYLQGLRSGAALQTECRAISIELPAIDQTVAAMSYPQLIEMRAASRKIGRGLLDAIEKNKDPKAEASLTAAHDSALALIDDLSDEFDRRDAAGTRDPIPHFQRPIGPDTVAVSRLDSETEDEYETRVAVANGREPERPSGWVDDQGNPVRVLAPNEKLTERRAAGPGVGDLVRAMIYGPRNDTEKRALAEGTNSAGGYTVPAPLASYFIDKLRADSVCIRAGARTVDLTSNTLAIARLEADPSASWMTENGPITASDATFGRVLFVAKKLVVLVKMSRELLEDTVNAGAMIDQAFSKSMALELDRVGLYGTGVDPQPLGIANTPGINTASMGANGSTPTSWDPLIDATYEISLDNAGTPTATIYHPRTWKTFAKLKDANGQPLRVPDAVAELPKLTTTAMPINETVGTSNDCSSIITGNFAHMMIGVRKQLEIIRADTAFITNDQVAFLARLRADIQLAHPEAFNRTTGVRG